MILGAFMMDVFIEVGELGDASLFVIYEWGACMGLHTAASRNEMVVQT